MFAIQSLTLVFSTLALGILANFLYDILRVGFKKLRRYIKRAKK